MPAIDTRDFIIIGLLVVTGLLALHILVDRVRRKHRPPAHSSAPPARQTPPRILGSEELQADVHFQATLVSTRPRVDQLTKREREVAELAALGMSNRQIAAELKMSVSTVQNHLRHIYEKLQISSRAELAWWWAQHADDQAA